MQSCEILWKFPQITTESFTRHFFLEALVLTLPTQCGTIQKKSRAGGLHTLSPTQRHLWQVGIPEAPSNQGREDEDVTQRCSKSKGMSHGSKESQPVFSKIKKRVLPFPVTPSFPPCPVFQKRATLNPISRAHSDHLQHL